MPITERAVIEITADTKDVKRQFQEMEDLGRQFGRSLSRAFRGAVSGGNSLADILEGLARRLADLALDASFKPIENMVSSLFGQLFKSVSPFADGGIVGASSLAPFAAGGVVSEPTFFPLGTGRLGVMGEAGTEAILPLARGPDGRLGVRAEGAGAPVNNISVTIQTQDLASFRRSEAQIAATLARAVGRGRRGL